MKFKLRQEGAFYCIFTLGLCDDGLPEIRLRLKDPSLVDDGYCLIKTAVQYMRDQACVIKSGETMSFGYWVVRFEDGGDALDVWELDDEWSDVVPGAERALRFWHDQAEVCRSAGSEFVPPLAHTMALVSAGVMEGEPIEGVRYPAPPHMSGWYLTTHLYGGDFSSMRATGEYVIDNIPFFVRDATVGDTIAVREEDGQRWFDRVVAESTSSLIRVIAYNRAYAPAVRDQLHALGCETEYNGHHNLIAVDVPGTTSLARVQEFLAQEASADRIGYEEPILRQD